jgi:Ca2+-binding RTX toxin-like protein
MERMFKRLPLPFVLCFALLPGGVALASTSHAGWPKINGDLKMHKRDQNGPLRATKLKKHNELLGGHGHDDITGGHTGDVLWGDYKPSGQPATQVDHIDGGGGRDFIYASHGLNFIDTGEGSDVVHAHFGHGRITCHGAKTIVYISHRSRPHYDLTGCRRISYKTTGH